MSFLKSSDEILSVGEFTRRFKTLVKLQVPELWIRGEVSNLKTYSSGHSYFKLKDSEGLMSAVLFKGYARGLSFKLRDGMQILAYGEISVYEGSGQYQLVIKALMPDGQGDLAARFEALKKKLSAEGLFDASRKKSIPQLPKRVAVITSPTGAAIRDFLKILRRRNWNGEVYILPSRVQGVEAPSELVDRLKFAENYVFEDGKGFDVAILMRGGGSLEDLWSFNEEIVARAVAESPLPTISAVGHEIDFSLSDFAADLRAETPSAAAEYISSFAIELREKVSRVFSDISTLTQTKLLELRHFLDSAKDILRVHTPSSKINSLRIFLDELDGRINFEVHKYITNKSAILSQKEISLARISPESHLNSARERLFSIEKQLGLLNPENTLKRGFAMVFDSGGKRIVRASETEIDKNISLKFSDGEVDSKVSNKRLS